MKDGVSLDYLFSQTNLNPQKREGEGTYTYKDNSLFIGIFKDNEKHGIGRMSYGINGGDYYGNPGDSYILN